MKNEVSDILEQGRLTEGHMGSDSSYGLTGMFHVLGPCGATLRIISGSGLGWEHVSVSLQNRCPNWPEMCFVKDLFWGDSEVVMQLHPAKSDYINIAKNCLHLWKPIDQEIPLPDSIMVGPKMEAA